MNIHAINITESHMKHTLVFHLKMDDTNITEETENAAIDILFRHGNLPTFTMYDLKKSYPPGVSEINVVISPNFIKESGMYFISVLSRNFLLKKSSKEVVWLYEASLWKDICLGRVSEMWSFKNCYVMETTNHNWTHCRCSSQEVTAFSAPVEWILSEIPINELIEPYINPIPSLVFVFLILIYTLLWYLNFQKDKLRHMNSSPVELKDNNPKHKQLYLICLKTGYYFSSGTTASVYIVLYGTKDVTETRQLIGKDTGKHFFQKGSTEVFLLRTQRSLGPLLKCDIWHDNQGDSPSWYLKAVCVKDLNMRANYTFNCHNWLSAETGDGQIERELTVAENPPSFKKILYENIVSFVNDFNMWNSVLGESPVSSFTGIQRVTCCLCFFLNCGLFLTLFEDILAQEALEDNALPLISFGTLFASLISALIATIPQVFYTILFRFSHSPSLEIKPGFVRFFSYLSIFNFNCLLKPKLSTSSRSTHRSSSSVSGSDSVYSSFEESSVMSVPLEESYSLEEEEEKDSIPLSFSCPDISDAVSPLQKTLSTWQTIENWLKKKQEIIKADVMKRHSRITESSSGALDSKLDLTEDNASQSDPLSVKCDIDNMNMQSINRELDLIGLYPCLPYIFYYLSWIMMLVNVMAASIFILFKASRFSVPYSLLLFKSILMSLVCSCVGITPVLILVFSFIYSLKSLCENAKKTPPDSVEGSYRERKVTRSECIESSYSRIEYFKKYLRPPKEQVLEQFRQIAAYQKRICLFYSDLLNFILVFVLLLAATYPNDVQIKYFQKSAIEKALFQTIPKTTQSLPSKLALLSWFEMHFLDSFFADHQCQDTDEDCGLSTGSIIVGSIIMRHFYSIECQHSNCTLYNHTHFKLFDFGDVYERRSLKGYYRSYYFEDEWLVMTDQIFYSYDEVHNFVEKLNSSSAGSLEFLLFNPTFSIFTSVSLLFEMTSLGNVIISPNISLVTVSSSSDVSSYLRIFFNLILFTYMMFDCKNNVWKMMKHKFQYWKQVWNYFSCVFILVYFVYLSFFVLYIIESEIIALKLQTTQLNSNINITEVALLDSIIYIFIGILIFLHVLRLFKVLSFSVKLKKMLKRVKYSQKNMSVAFLSFFIIILSSVVMTRCFVGSSSSFSHPVFGFIKVITSIFSYCGKPEVKEDISVFGQTLSVIVSLVLIIIHLYLFSVIRSVLLNCKYENNCLENKMVTLGGMKNIIKKFIQMNFKSRVNETVSQIEYVPPIDFLLYELERLADALVTKANSLFPDAMDSLESEYDSEKVELESGFDLLTNAIDVCNIKLSEFDDTSVDRLIATIPRRSKARFDSFLPSSFHASLGCDKKYETSEMSTILLQNKIRKTYPLSHLDSNSSTSSAHSQVDEKVNSVSSLLIRKTKSRGKGKMERFELDIESSDNEP